VDTTADDTTPDTTLSLREAIEVSDGTLAVSLLSPQEKAQVSGPVGASNTINFNIPTNDSGYDKTTGVWTIKLIPSWSWGPLTISTNAAIINGYSQPGASPNTLAIGDNAKLKIAIDGSLVGNTIGLEIAQPGSQLSGLDLEDFGFNGAAVEITAPGHVQVSGCFIGTNATGETAATNGTGVEIENSNNTIGGPDVADRNVISGNHYQGILVQAPYPNPLGILPTGNHIENNYIGLDAKGSHGLANVVTGVYDAGEGDTYGGTTAGLGNVISGNNNGGGLQDFGFEAYGSITIQGNYCGTDAAGNVALDGGGIFLSQGGATPGLTTIITNNVISGNNSDALSIVRTSHESQATYTIANNRVGTNAAGTAALGNAVDGIVIASVANCSILDNVIAGNARWGLYSTQNGSVVQHNLIQGNMIGTDDTGQVALGNGYGGILLSNATGDTIGGPVSGQGNVIADNAGGGIEMSGQQDEITHNSIAGNAGVGIALDSGQGIDITQNSIFGNTGVGIETSYGVNQNTVAPVLTFAPGSGSTGTLSGKLAGSPGLNFTVEIFSDPTALAPGHEQGRTFVTDVTVKIGGSGQGTFSLTEPYGFYAATATDPSGNTSAFSTVVGSPPLAASQTSLSSSANPSTAGEPVIFTAIVTAPGYQGTPTGTVVFTIDGQKQAPVALTVVRGMDEAQFITSALAAGSHSVSVSYNGDAKVAGSGASLPTQAVNPAPPKATTTTLVSSSETSSVGDSVTFTATVSPGTSSGMPTGTVTFTIDGVPEPRVPLQVVAGRDQATFSLSTLTAGAHTVRAWYNGDATFAASAVASPLTQTVNSPPPPNNPAATSTTVVSSTSPSVQGATVTLTATVAPTGGAGTPTGTVTFTIDGVAKLPVPLRVVGGRDQATFITTLAPGAHTIVAKYNGDPTFAASAVPHPLTQVVTAPAPSPSPTGTPANRPVATPAPPPPIVESLKRFGTRARRTSLVLAFSAPLDPARADNPGNYRIVGRHHRPVRIRSVVYNPAAETVTLYPRTKISLNRAYGVTVIGTGPGGVADVRDVLLDGHGDGRAGSDFVTTLTRSNLVVASGTRPASAAR
jgi:hypothetical protein